MDDRALIPLYNDHGMALLIAAVVRLWWRDALHCEAELAELADFLGVNRADLAGGPPRYRTPRDHAYDIVDNNQESPEWPRRQREPAYTRRGIGGD